MSRFPTTFRLCLELKKKMQRKRKYLKEKRRENVRVSLVWFFIGVYSSPQKKKCKENNFPSFGFNRKTVRSFSFLGAPFLFFFSVSFLSTFRYSGIFQSYFSSKILSSLPPLTTKRTRGKFFSTNFPFFLLRPIWCVSRTSHGDI